MATNVGNNEYFIQLFTYLYVLTGVEMISSFEDVEITFL